MVGSHKPRRSFVNKIGKNTYFVGNVGTRFVVYYQNSRKSIIYRKELLEWLEENTQNRRAVSASLTLKRHEEL